jgi:hypothetical protein
MDRRSENQPVSYANDFKFYIQRAAGVESAEFGGSPVDSVVGGEVILGEAVRPRAPATCSSGGE